MSLARLVITAVTVEGRTKSAVARDYGITRFWVQTLVKRFEVEGEAAFAPHSRRPHTNPRAVDLEIEDQIVRLRKTLTKKGLDAGAETIAAHLATTGVDPVPATSTIWRILSRRGFVVRQPQKRPRSSWKRFCADQPNERWQTDITHWRLADGTEVEILNILDDHSRVCIASIARRVTTGSQVWASFAAAFTRWGVPAEVLSDNGAVFTGKQRGQGRVALEVQCGLHGIRISHSRPYHPQTCGKVERFHQTLKKWLRAQPAAATIAGLQRQLNRFQHYYNTLRPHRALGRRTPAQAYAAPTQGRPDRPGHPRPPPSPNRHHRQLRLGHRPPQQPAAPHRPRRPPARHPRAAAHRRPAHPHRPPPHRRAAPRTHLGPHPRLPTPRRPTRPTQTDRSHTPADIPIPAHTRHRSRGQGWPQATHRATALTPARTAPPSTPRCRTH